ncbi:hypothetical protein [Salinigranum salinum]|uniref:hypothetical protein n=1 Tax=Salinigranum salinum TaxID=1364937 RepID=UPI0012611636|nr:hypothetical protein [Salinigranum salinum]
MFEGDDRGQSIQIGAILLFGLLIVGLSFTQAFVVPQENRGVEFGSYVKASDDLTAYYHDVLAAGTQGSQTGQTVQTGVRYPTRTILVNPGPAAGTVRTTATRNVTIAGVQAVSGEHRNVRGFWDTDTRGPRNYSTRHVEFDPGYNELDASPVVVSGVGTYRLGSGGQVALTEQSFLSGNRITLVTVDGEVETGGISTSLSAAPTSVATRSVTVTGDGGSDFTITLPVPGDATAWNASSGARSLRGNPNVVGTEVNGSRVDVTFDGSARYTLRLAKVTVRDSSDSGIEPETAPQYIVPVDGNGTQVPATGTRAIGVEVRDVYNNPVAGSTVEFTATDGSFPGGATTTTVTTGADGRASVEFNISKTTDVATLTAEIDGAGRSPYNETTITLARQAAGTDTGTDSINPAEDGSIKLVEAIESGGGSTNATITFDNTLSESVRITSIRFSFYHPISSGGEVADTATIGGKTVGIPGTIETLPNEPVLDPGLDTVTISFSPGGVNTDGDFFVATVTFDKVDGRQTYFVVIQKP